jgi:predicted ATPase
VGKTRLALQVAKLEQSDFADGIVFVPLAPIRTPDLVLQTIARALEATEGIGHTLLDSLKAHLRDKHLLLVLDNFEHVLDAAPLVGELLAASNHLKVLTTSRAVLHVSGEYEFAVPPLPLPNLQHLPEFGELQQYDALRLFQERAQAANPNFVLTPDNIATVAAICLRLDGLPLAIELAAPRSKIFTPVALLTRLDRRLALLVGGGRDLPPRQQTLYSAIAWSYDLLDTGEQRLFRRLAIFRGGFTIEAALKVCNIDGDLQLDVVEGLISLVDKSLLQVEPYSAGEPRFTMLETVQEYALGVMELHTETETVCSQHARYYVRLIEMVAADLTDDDDIGLNDDGLEQLFVENANLTAMAIWIQERNEQDLMLRLSTALWDSGLTLVIGARALTTWTDVSKLQG